LQQRRGEHPPRRCLLLLKTTTRMAPTLPSYASVQNGEEGTCCPWFETARKGIIPVPPLLSLIGNGKEGDYSLLTVIFFGLKQQG
jgi:hypothetical protein